MARTKQTARKSTGGRPPRKQLRRYDPVTNNPTIKDHEQNLVKLATRFGWLEDGLGCFPFQVYILDTASGLANDVDFAGKLCHYINSNNTTRFNENVRYHLQIYLNPQKDVFDCIAHHEREKQYRKCQGRGPVMLNRKEFMVIDSYEWESEGVISVEYTAELIGRDSTERNLENHVNDYRWGFGFDEDEEEEPLQGLRQDLIVKRHKDPNSLVERFLHEVYVDEGHEWRTGDLVQRTAAMGWPCDFGWYDDEQPTTEPKPVRSLITRGWLPTETRPNAEDYEEEDDDEHLKAEEFRRQGMTTFGEECDPDTGVPWSLKAPPYPYPRHRRAPKAEESPPPLPEVALHDISVEEEVDSIGRVCTTVHHTSSAAVFSYSIYVLGNAAVPPNLLFAYLNRGLLAKTPWCLHVYRVQSLSEALSHNTAEMQHRPDGSSRRPFDYSGPYQSTIKNIFLAIDIDRPLEPGPWLITPDDAFRSPSTVLSIEQAGNWSDISQMLFSYHLFCGETTSLVSPLSTTPPPHLEASISIPPECSTHRDNDETWHATPTEMLCPLSLHLTLPPTTPGPITLSIRSTIADPNFFSQHFKITDISTGSEVPTSNPERYDWMVSDRGTHWLCTNGFMEGELRGGFRCMMTLYPGQTVENTVAWVKSTVFERYRDGLEVGGRYRVGIREGTVVERWVWGYLEEELRDEEGSGDGKDEEDRDGNVEMIGTNGGKKTDEYLNEAFGLKGIYGKNDPVVSTKNLKGPFGLPPLEVRAMEEPYFTLVGKQDIEESPLL